MRNRIVTMLLIFTLAITSLTGCSFGKSDETQVSNPFIKEQQELGSYEGTVEYQIKADVRMTILPDTEDEEASTMTAIEGVPDVLDISKQTLAKVYKNKVKYEEINDSEILNGEKQDPEIENIWYDTAAGQKYVNVVDNTWEYSKTDEHDTTIINLPSELNNNEELAKLMQSNMDESDEENDDADITVSIPIEDIEAAGVSIDKILNAAFFSSVLPETSTEPDGNVDMNITYDNDTGRMSHMTVKFDEDGQACIKDKYETFGIELEDIKFDISATYKDDEKLDIPNEITSTAKENVNLNGTTAVESAATLSEAIMNKSFTEVADLLQMFQLPEDILQEDFEYQLSTDETVSIKQKELFDALANILTWYSEDELGTILVDMPDDEESNIEYYLANYLAYDIICQSGIVSDEAHENLANILFDGYELITIEGLDQCVKDNYNNETTALMSLMKNE